MKKDGVGGGGDATYDSATGLGRLRNISLYFGESDNYVCFFYRSGKVGYAIAPCR